ncbi:MAG: hypothetical protein J6X05_00590 [Bacteroidales bacterium]|nr:hypothetical protein [Bacteroidales bacterium]
MQIRLVRMAARKWKTTVARAARFFDENGVFHYIGIRHFTRIFAIADSGVAFGRQITLLVGRPRGCEGFL